ncbi:MAG: hypothetical protein U9R32_05620, partial [Bacteroidota bacterium]|nr:hypothetical protein [Bacteroidota bacterium]
MKIFIKNLFLVTFFLGGLSVKSQEGVPYSISLNGGATIFYGDVKEYRFAPTTLHNSEIRPAGELQFRYFMSDYFAFNGTF